MMKCKMNFLVLTVLMTLAVISAFDGAENQYSKLVRFKILGFKIDHLQSVLIKDRCADYIHSTGNLVGKRSVSLYVRLQLRTKLFEHLLEAYIQCLSVNKTPYSVVPTTSKAETTSHQPTTSARVYVTSTETGQSTQLRITTQRQPEVCSRISSVQTPQALSFCSSCSGVLLQDDTKHTDTVYHMGYWTTTTVSVYQSLAYYTQNTNTPNTLYQLPFKCNAGSAIVSDGHLLCVRYQSREIYKYSFKNKSVVISRNVARAEYSDCRKAGYLYYCNYQQIDLAQDEVGLWAIYVTSESDGKIVVSRLDPDDLSVRHTFKTNITKNQVGHGIMRCGQLYTTNHHYNTPINFTRMFNTRTDSTENVSIPLDDFVSDHERLYWMDYNPRTQALYGWKQYSQSFQQVIYRVN